MVFLCVLLFDEISFQKRLAVDVKIFKREKKINNNNINYNNNNTHTHIHTHITNNVHSHTHTHSDNLNDSHVVTREHTLLVSRHVHTLTPTITLYGQNLDRVTLGKG